MAHHLHEAYERLFSAYGPQSWWPAESPFEVIIGAVLTQNTSWNNVEKAIANLRSNDLLDPLALYRIPVAELEELIRPAGYFRLKAQRLHNLLQWLIDRYDGSLDAMFSTNLGELREQLLAVSGIGPETADSILLYAGNLPTFVVDTYTYRVCSRHGWIDFQSDYHEIKEHFESVLAQDARLYNEYHALLVRVGKEHCRKQRPICEGCPLQPLLPEGGPRSPDL